MDLRQLRYFVLIAEAGSMTKAAAGISVAQPVLSRAMRDLEVELGIALLSRNGRGVLLTEAGARLLAHAKTLTCGADSAKKELLAMGDAPSGDVAVGMAPSLGELMWAPLVSTVRARFPKVSLQVNEGYSGQVMEWLLTGKIDVGIAYQSALQSTVMQEVLFNEKLCLVGPSSSKLLRKKSVSFDELAKIPLILPAQPHAIRRVLESRAARQGIQLTVDFEVNAFPAIRQLVTSLSGYTVLPAAAVNSEVLSGQLKVSEIVDPALSLPVSLLTTSHHPNSAATRAVCRVVKELSRQLAAEESAEIHAVITKQTVI